jgi:hypothetical protein
MNMYSLNFSGGTTADTLTSSEHSSESQPLVEYLTPAGRRVVAGLIALSLLDLLVCNIGMTPKHEAEIASAAQPVFAVSTLPPVAAAVAPMPGLRVESMALRALPGPTRITDLEMPGDVSMGMSPLPQDRADEQAAEVGPPIYLMPPRELHIEHSKHLVVMAKPVTPAPKPVNKPAFDDFVDSNPTPFFSMRSMMEAKGSAPRPF